MHPSPQLLQRLSSKVAIVTGSSSGLGRAIALAYAREGAHVLCADIAPAARRGPDENTTPTHEAITQLNNGARSAFHECNVTDAKNVESTVARAVKEFGRLDM
jgi:NAD(P)-dependent dehydrogenase (short-subunit alcohol dehydrogenase family)